MRRGRKGEVREWSVELFVDVRIRGIRELRLLMGKMWVDVRL